MLLLMELNLGNVLIILYIHKHKSQLEREVRERESATAKGKALQKTHFILYHSCLYKVE